MAQYAATFSAPVALKKTSEKVDWLYSSTKPASVSRPHEFELKRTAFHGSHQTQKRTAPRRNTAPMVVE
jgi:hypothetical protein